MRRRVGKRQSRFNTRQASNRSSRISEEGIKQSIENRTQATHTNTSNPRIPEASLHTAQSFSNERQPL